MAKKAMWALTLHQPWAWAIAHADKDVENRTWQPIRGVVGTPIAIHAGKEVDEEAYAAFKKGLYGPQAAAVDDWPMALGGVVAVATVDRVETLGPGPAPFSRWYAGPYGWVLRDVVPLLAPVPCRGMQMLWHLPPDVEAAVRGQLEVQHG